MKNDVDDFMNKTFSATSYSSNEYHVAYSNITIPIYNEKKLTIKEKFIKNLILFLVGYCIYIAIEVTYRGQSFPLMGIVSGIVVLLIDRINDEISWDLDLFYQCLIGSCIITMSELIIGTIAKYSPILPVMWDYSKVPFNFNGVICLPFSIIWLFLSAVAIFVADAINYYVFEDTEVPHYILFKKIKFSFKKKKCDIN